MISRKLPYYRARQKAKRREAARKWRETYQNTGATGALLPMDGSPCQHCTFLADCRHYLARNLDPYCFPSSPRYPVFVRANGGKPYEGAQP